MGKGQVFTTWTFKDALTNISFGKTWRQDTISSYQKTGPFQMDRKLNNISVFYSPSFNAKNPSDFSNTPAQSL